MRILRSTTSIEPQLGGPSHSTLNCSGAEVRFGGVRTTIVHTVAAGQDTVFAVPPTAGVTVLAFPRSRWIPAGPAQRWGASVGLVRWLAGSIRTFDVVHAEYVWSFGTIASVALGRLYGVPVVLTPHESLTSFGIATSRSRIRGLQKSVVRRLLLGGVCRVLFTSGLEQRDSGVADDRGRVLPLPVIPDDAGVPAVRYAPRDPLVVGFLGRLHEKKRLPWLLRSVAAIGPSVRLVIGGADPPEALQEARSLAEELGIADRVSFEGFVPATGRDAFFASIDVLAMPSQYECFGMVAAEAMSAAVPVVVSDHTGVADLVGLHGAGAVVAVDDEDGFRASIAALAAPERYAECSRRAAAAAVDAFSPEAYARSVRAVYDEVTAG